MFAIQKTLIGLCFAKSSHEKNQLPLTTSGIDPMIFKATFINKPLGMKTFEARESSKHRLNP